MQVVSGPIGKDRVHFEAPAAPSVDMDMKSFLDWFNANSDTGTEFSETFAFGKHGRRIAPSGISLVFNDGVWSHPNTILSKALLFYPVGRVPTRASLLRIIQRDAEFEWSHYRTGGRQRNSTSHNPSTRVRDVLGAAAFSALTLVTSGSGSRFLLWK